MISGAFSLFAIVSLPLAPAAGELTDKFRVKLVLSAILLIITHFMAVIEERSGLNKFGNAYREYINRRPRWIGIPKSGGNK